MKVKNGNRQQRVVLHDAEDAQRQRLHQRGRQQAELDADEAEEQAAGGQRERHREAHQQEDDQAGEHDRRHVGVEEFDHALGSVVRRLRGLRLLAPDRLGEFLFGGLGLLRRVGSSIRPRRKAMRLISSDTPCSPSSAKPSGTSAYTGQRIRPPALDDISPLSRPLITSGQTSSITATTNGNRKTDDAEDLDLDLRALGEAAEDHVDLHVLLAQQRVAGGRAGRPRRTGTTGSRGRRSS